MERWPFAYSVACWMLSRAVPGADYRGLKDTGGLFTTPEIGRGWWQLSLGSLNKQIALYNCGWIISGILITPF